MWIKRFTQGDDADPEYQEKVIRIFVNSVYLFDNQVLIYFNVKDGKRKCYVDHIAEIDELESIITNAKAGSTIERYGGR